MFDTIWKNSPLWKRQDVLSGEIKSQVHIELIKKVALLHWQEHCLECAPPECYSECALYMPRKDRKCVRFEYGVYPNPGYRGVVTYGADIHFRRWATVETRFYCRAVSLRSYRLIDRISRSLSAATLTASTLLLWASPYMRIAGALNYFREKLLLSGSINEPQDFDSFILECYSAEKTPFNLILRCDNKERGIYYQHAFNLKPGHNYFEISFAQMQFPADSCGDRMTLFPENNIEARLIITCCDFVKYANFLPAKSVHPDVEKASATARNPAKKVKCVCWDLDNTLWKGILIEDGPDKVEIRSSALDTIRNLDERGILQTIVSKNAYEQVWPRIEKARLQDYFLYPAINWNPKSVNISKIAKCLNIGIDAFALIDDSPYERAEVSATLPAVRTYRETEVPDLLNYPEFQVPVSIESKSRRLSYLTEISRQRVQQETGLDDVDFLKSCEMVLEIHPLETAEIVERCWELCERSNQLNLSTRRYSMEQFKALLSTEGVKCFALKCHDRFGDYGVIGFSSVEENVSPDCAQLVDLVISCRVARKYVEQTFIQWLAGYARSLGKSSLRAYLIKTDKNGPMADIFSGMPFSVVQQDGKTVLYQMALHDEVAIDNYLALIVRGSNNSCTK